jgi:PPK2 family polyphosphate:nucleotide phosphotransferase
MSLEQEVLDEILVVPGQRADLRARDTAWKGGNHFKDLAHDQLKGWAAERLQANVQELAEAQELLYADDTYAVLVVFQAMDAAGKDGTIKHVMSGVNPQGVQVYSFKQPSSEELDHNFLWRYWKAVPERGRIGIFNRSYYEEVLVQKVHPEWLDRQRLPPGPRGAKLWRGRYRDINAFEEHLDRNGVKVVKFFLHVSKEEQRQRFLARLDDEAKHWKFSAADLKERAHWDAYQDAYEEALTATSTKWAPWYVIPADHKWVMRTIVSGVLAALIRSLDLAPPVVTKEQEAELEVARQQLLADGT